MTLPHQLPYLITGLGISGAVFAVLTIVFRTDRRVQARIRALDEQDPAVVAVERRPDGILAAVLRLFSPRSVASSAELHGRLSHAGFQSPHAVHVFCLMQLLSSLTVGLAALWFTQFLPPRAVDGLLATLIGGCLGFLLPSHLLKRRTVRRQRSLERALPDFLDLLVACMDAGLSLEGALQRISEELKMAHPILGAELVRVQRDIELGATPDRALGSFAERTDVDVLRTISSACSQARRFGSRLSQTMRGLADTLRQQREQRAEEAAQVSAVKILFPTLVLLFPIIFVVLAGPAAIQIVEQFSKAGMTHAQ